MRALVTGATGLVGSHLVARLEGAVVLTRNVERAARGLGARELHAWEPERGLPPVAAINGAQVVFNFSGEPIAQGRWTNEKKRRIRDSRILATRNLVAGLAALQNRPRVLVSASAVGYYGDRGDTELDETAAGGHGFLAEVCGEWEKEAVAAEELGIRVICARLGVVLAPDGGALARMLPVFRMAVGGRIGNGQQWMSWVHIDDVVGILLHVIRTEEIRGPVNVVGPAPATNAELTRALGKAVHRPAFFRVPKAALRLAFGEMSQVLTESQRVLPTVAARSGYAFKYADLNVALGALLSPQPR
jgi:uncharacterized protein